MISQNAAFGLALAPPFLPNESAMLADPVDGLLSGLRSGVARTITALLAIFVGFAICYLSVGWTIEVLWAWVGLGLGLIFWWGTFGGWFFVGLASLVLMLAFLWSFAQERAPKFSLFATFSFAVVYFLPLAFHAQRWVWTLCFYLVAAF